MFFLSIETSCDETSISLLEGRQDSLQSPSSTFLQKINSLKVISQVISSQIEIHSQYGGVVPELAAREHTKNIHLVFTQMLGQIVAKIDQTDTPDFSSANLLKNPEIKNIFKDLSKIFVTTSPGLPSALKVGLEFARSLKFFLQSFGLSKNIELVEVNHLKGHLYSAFFGTRYANLALNDTQIFPHLHLLVSGGNTQLFLLNSDQKTELLGQTLDDAVGETLDKIGRMVGLRYPAGKLINQICQDKMENSLNLPIGMHNHSLDFSFSGLKTAVRYLVQKQTFESWKFEQLLRGEEIESLKSATGTSSKHLSFIYKLLVSSQTVIINQLSNKLKIAINQTNPASIGISGGVSANSLLRKEIQKLGVANIFYPDLSLTGDNATMIALAGIARDF